MKLTLHNSSNFENCRFLHLSAMIEIYAKLGRWVDVWWIKLHSIWHKAAETLCCSSDFGRRMSGLYHSTADSELCERSIIRVNTRLKNNQTLRAVVKRSVNKQNKPCVQTVVEMYEAVSLFLWHVAVFVTCRCLWRRLEPRHFNRHSQQTTS
jgi:hypothetical protein